MPSHKSEEKEEEIVYSFIDALLLVEKELADHCKLIFEKKKINFQSRIKTKIGTESKREYIRSEIQETQRNIDDDTLGNLYSYLSLPMEEGVGLANTFKKSASQFNEAVEDADVPGKAVAQETVDILSHGKVELNKNVFSNLIHMSRELGEANSFVEELLKKKKPKQALCSALFFHHYERKYLEFLAEKLDELEVHQGSESEIKQLKSEFTTAQQVLAIWYLLEQLDVNANIDKTEVARFIQFITGKETGAAKINDTTIYKKLKTLLRGDKKQLNKDLRVIRPLFEKLGLKEIADQIDKEIASKR